MAAAHQPDSGPVAATHLPEPPPSRRDPVTEVLHGETLTDDYRWLEDARSAETLAWVHAQNAYVDAVLKSRPEVARMREALASTMRGETLSAPSGQSGRILLLRRGPGQDQPVLVARSAASGEERVVYDPGAEAEQPTTIDWYVPSGDGRYVAIGTSLNGDEESTLRIVDLESGAELGERIARTRFSSIAWRKDGEGFYYTHHPMPGAVPAGEEVYHQHVAFHRLGDDPARDADIYGSGRPLMESHRVSLSEDGRHLFILSGDGWRAMAVRRIDLEHPQAPPAVILDGYDAMFEGSVSGGRLVLKTNAGAPRYRIVAIDPERPAEDEWEDIVPESDLVVREFALSGDRVLVHALKDVVARAFVVDRATHARVDVKLPGEGTVSAVARGPADDFLLLYESFTQAPTLYRVDPVTGDLTLVCASTTSELVRGLDIRQVFATSGDGTRFPMYIVQRADLGPGPHPTLLTGYGGFNLVRTSKYMPEILPWLQAGGVFAQANMRGGGEYGDGWHRAAMLDKRQCSYDDFFAAAEHLIGEGITDTDHLGIEGRSLGGLVMGVCLTQRPELFKAVVCGVPLIDMLRYHLFLIGARWIVEYGTPDKAEEYAWIRGYSPYQMVREGVHYPATYFFAAMDDARVDALHARKMAARMQAATQGRADRTPMLLRSHFNAGHGVGKPLSASIEEQAEIWGFLAWQCGLAV